MDGGSGPAVLEWWLRFVALPHHSSVALTRCLSTIPPTPVLLFYRLSPLLSPRHVCAPPPSSQSLGYVPKQLLVFMYNEQTNHPWAV